MPLLDLIFLKRCVQCKKFGAYLCPACFSFISFLEHGFYIACQRPANGGATHPSCRTRYSIDGVFSSLVYSGIVKKLIYQFKYQPNLSNLKNLLTGLYYEGLIQKELFYSVLTKETVLIPIPLHPVNLRKREYSQSLLLAKGLSGKFNLKVLNNLERVKNTATQVGLSKEKRHENIRNAFTLKDGFKIQQKALTQVILIGDVATSGASLNEAAKVLKKASVKTVWGEILAHGQ